MTINLLGFAVVLGAVPCLAANPIDIQDNYFREGWSRVEAAPVVTDPASRNHAPIAHMDITRKAYEVYSAQYDGGELAQYIGDAKDGSPIPDNEDTVVAGSHDEDKAGKNPWGETFPMANHFWDCRQGYYAGWQDYDSGVNRAHKYWSGGFGIEGRYDSDWESGGAKNEGVIGLYRKGDKAKSYWYLGHVAHLLEDLTVPAHTLLFTHIGEGTDAYETYMKHHFSEWAPGPQPPIETFDKLLDLFYQTANTTNDFDAGSGPDSGADGKKDKGARRAGGFTEDQLKEEGRVLMPLAYRRVASLFLLFYKQLDKTPPKVTLREPRSTTAEVVLEADAVDSQSGVDRRGYVFEFRERGGDAWRRIGGVPTVRTVVFFGKPDHAYDFRVSAMDAVGNRASSAPLSWMAGPAGVAGL